MRCSGVLLVAALSSLGWAGAAAAQSAFPTRPVKLVLAFGPGGSVDVIARMIGPEVAKHLGQPLIIENKPGADGDLAGETVARAPADGYTMLMTSHAVAVNVTLRPKRAYKLEDLAPVMLFADTQAVLAVPASSTAKSMQDLIALAKAQPGKLDYGSTGVGTSGHLAMELFRLTAGIDVVHVPFRNVGQWMTDFIAGRIMLGMPTIPAASSHIKAGRLRALGASGTRRSQALPDVPTIAEAGLPGYSATTWYGLFATSGTPAASIDKLNASFKAAISEPAIRSRLLELGVEPIGSTADELARHATAEVKRWGDVVVQAKISAE